jgi:hypothetical protein
LKLAEAKQLVRKAIEEIKKGESGALPPTAYVVVEVGRRMATVKTWDGRANEPLLLSIRKLVDEELKARPVPRIAYAPQHSSEEGEVSKPLDDVYKLQRRWGGTSVR